MFASHASWWPLAAAAGATVVASGLRCLALLVGFRLALKSAPKMDRLAVYREFARAVSLRAHTDNSGQPSISAQRPHATPGASSGDVGVETGPRSRTASMRRTPRMRR
jgi:hypothetical protein